MNTLSFTAILFFSISSSVFTSCHGQNNSQNADSNFNGVNLNVALGDTVSEIDRNVWCVFQDNSGNFWFGSDGQGVYRYDGVTLMHYLTKHGLCNDHIRETNEDNAGNVYFTVFGIRSRCRRVITS